MPKVQISLRLEEDTFNEAKEILKSLGMNFTEAVNVFASSYSSISYEEAQKKVQRSIDNISKNEGVPSDAFFEKMLG